MRKFNRREFLVSLGLSALYTTAGLSLLKINTTPKTYPVPRTWRMLEQIKKLPMEKQIVIMQRGLKDGTIPVESKFYVEWCTWASNQRGVLEMVDYMWEKGLLK